MPARKCSQRSSNSTPASENSAIEDLRVVGIRDSASQDSQGPEPCKPEGRPLSGLPHGLLEQLQNAPVLVRPTVRPPEAVRLDRIHGHLPRSEEHTSELQSLAYLVCRLVLEKKKKKSNINTNVT